MTIAGRRLEVFETRDFYLACFLRCTGYELLDFGPKAIDGFSCFGIGQRGAST
jgi:hypothetical protein